MDYGNVIANNCWFPFTFTDDIAQYPPLVITRGEGVYFYDDQGKPYIDGISSWWVNILGHCNPVITEAIRKQALKLEHVLMAGAISDVTVRLTETLCRVLPPQLQRVFYSDNGSTAVEVALKIALQYWAWKKPERSAFVTLGGAYHGDTLAAMSVGAIPQYHDMFHRLFKKQLVTDPPNCYRCVKGKKPDLCNAECMDSLQTILEIQGKTVAACIVEPMVQGAVGMRMYPAKVLQRIFALCKEHDVLTIADEVAMGFGRTGRMFACEHAGVVPDIMCLAKGLTGGYLPMAATVVRQHVFEAFSGDYHSGNILYHGHSFTGNPLAAAAALATQEILLEQQVPLSLQPKIGYFQSTLHEVFGALPCIGEVRSIGMIGALELVRDKATKETFAADKRIPFHICRKALEYGLFVRPLGNVLYFIPPYIITEDQIRFMFDAMRRSIEEIVSEE